MHPLCAAHIRIFTINGMKEQFRLKHHKMIRVHADKYHQTTYMVILLNSGQYFKSNLNCIGCNLDVYYDISWLYCNGLSTIWRQFGD